MIASLGPPALSYLGTPDTVLPPCQPINTLNQISPSPSNPVLEIHCDGSFLNDSQKAAYGVIVVDDHGDICDGRAATLVCSAPLEVEAKTLLEALLLACNRAVQAGSGPTVFPWFWPFQLRQSLGLGESLHGWGSWLTSFSGTL
ncbi:unnamed protein product [Linum trigynum]|uniref:RNase H type-1 domain-containing protein n=1 Tax=Linum trigynum TaxID=586398 RepID=A0AAV2CGZ4_9ROSI